MSTVSVVNCVSPVSLRTCGSSTGSLLQRRRQLQRTSSIKRLLASPSRDDDFQLHCRSPVPEGLERALVASPLFSPVPQSPMSPYSHCRSSALVNKSASSFSSPSRDEDFRLQGRSRIQGGLERTLVASPLLSPAPLNPSHLVNKSPSYSSDGMSEENLDDHMNGVHDSSDLCIVGSKPYKESKERILPKSVCAGQIQTASPVMNLLPGDMLEVERMRSASPCNPPSSPINYRLSIEDFLVGGKKLSYPERDQSMGVGNSLDFRPGFVRAAPQHCGKCEGRMMQQEQSQVVLHRRFSQVMNTTRLLRSRHDMRTVNDVCHGATTPCSHTPSKGYHSSMSHFSKSGYDITIPYTTCSNVDEKPAVKFERAKSFVEINSERRKEKQEELRARQLGREKRKEERRYEELVRLYEKISLKEERSKAAARKKRSRLAFTTVRPVAPVGEDLERNKQAQEPDKQIPSNSVRRQNSDAKEDYDVTEICPSADVPIDESSVFKMPIRESDSDSETQSNLSIESYMSYMQLPSAKSQLRTRSRHSMNITLGATAYDDNCLEVDGYADDQNLIRRCLSDIYSFSRISRDAESGVSDVRLNPLGVFNDTESGILRRFQHRSSMTPTIPLISNIGRNRCNTNEYCVTSDVEPNERDESLMTPHDVSSEEAHAELEHLAEDSTTTSSPVHEEDIDRDDDTKDTTMTSTMIVPSPQVPCSQWVSFNADNEPVLNTAPEVDDGCDTFLKRLQRTRVQNPSDSCLPSGQQFCFEAMVDKRYNRWKRRRRKKNGDLRRIHTVPCLSESSDENDERTSAVERILDRMYEQIHGPAPQTPNGTRDTPRIRNRRRRNLDGDGNCTPTSQGGNSDEESGSIPLHYDASEEWTSSTDVIGVSSSSGQQPVHQSNSPNYFTYTNTDRCSKYDDSAEDGKLTNKCALSDGHCGPVRVDLCDWPYLEQYKQQIMERIQKTSEDELEELDKREWLPAIGNNYDDEADDNGNDGLDDEADDSEITLTGEDHNELMISISQIAPSEPPKRRVYQEGVKESERDPKRAQLQRLAPAVTTYSYTKWSSLAKNKKSVTAGAGSRPLSRSSCQTLSDMSTDPQSRTPKATPKRGSLPQNTRPIRTVNSFNKNISKREVRKELYGTQKQNLNLPSLGKNERVQTIPIHSRRDSVVSLQDARKKASLATPESGGKEGRPRTQTTDGGRTAAAERSGQPVPDFLFRDFYLRKLYGKKVHVNSHVESYKNGGRLRKSLTVDGLESGGRKFPRKAVADVAKPSELRFTRAFTFSMFNLPEMYQLYNTSLERRALGQGADL